MVGRRKRLTRKAGAINIKEIQLKPTGNPEPEDFASLGRSGFDLIFSEI